MAAVQRSFVLLIANSAVSIGRRRSIHFPCLLRNDVEVLLRRPRGWCSWAKAPPAAAEMNHAHTEEEAASSSPPSDPIREAGDALDIRVGRIIRAWRHPEADSLYVEEVDVGEAELRTICSGLVKYVSLEHLQWLRRCPMDGEKHCPHLEDIKVVVLANLKPRNMRGIKSNGMLLAASDASHETVELLAPPEGSVPGERIWFGSVEDKERQPDAATPNQVQKKKIWETVQPHLKTTDACEAVLGVRPMRTSAGIVVSRSLKNANIA